MMLTAADGRERGDKPKELRLDVSQDLISVHHPSLPISHLGKQSFAFVPLSYQHKKRRNTAGVAMAMSPQSNVKEQ